MKRKGTKIRPDCDRAPPPGNAQAVEHVLPRSNGAVWHRYANDDLPLGNFMIITKPQHR